MKHALFLLSATAVCLCAAEPPQRTAGSEAMLALASREPAGSFVGFTRETATNFSTASLRPTAAGTVAAAPPSTVRVEEPAEEPSSRPTRRASRRRSRNAPATPASSPQPPPPKCPVYRTFKNWWTHHTPFHAKQSAHDR